MKRFSLIFLMVLSLCSFAEEAKLSDFLSHIEIGEVPECGLKTIDATFVINLDNRPHKLKYLKKHLDRNNIDFYRFSAVNGWKIPRKEYRNFIEDCTSFDGNVLNPGQLGCLLSHLSIYFFSSQQNLSNILVLEDDALVLDDMKLIDEIITRLSVLDPEWDILYLDYESKETSQTDLGTFERHLPRNKFDYTLVEDPDFFDHEDEDLERFQYRLGTYSMVISKKGLQKIASRFAERKIEYPIDVELMCLENKRFYRLKKDLISTKTDYRSDTQKNHS